MKKVRYCLRILVAGWIVLLAAICVNVASAVLGVSTWFSFVGSIAESGFNNAVFELSFPSVVFLLFLYPLLLGFAAYFAVKYLLKAEDMN